MTPKLELYPHLDSVRNMDYMILYASCTCNFLTTSPPSIQLQHTPIKLFAPSVHVLEPQVLGAEWSWLVKAKAKYTYLRHHNLFKVKLHAPRGTKKADASHQESPMCSPSHIRIATIFAWTLTLYKHITLPEYIEYGIGVVTIFIGHQELELKTTYIESDKFIHRIFFPILKILLGKQRIHQLPHGQRPKRMPKALKELSPTGTAAASASI